jgi:adenine-specific DNA glycosylase
VEAQLTAVLPPARWTRASDALILHGRRICKPKPLCPRCNVRPHCDFYRLGFTTKPAKKTLDKAVRKIGDASTRKTARAKSSSLRAGAKKERRP